MEGIIYKVQPYLESSKLLYTYTPSGKVTLIARGAQKMTSDLRILSQYLTRIEFIYEKKAMFSLKGGQLIEAFDYIKKDIQLFKDVSYILELIDKAISENETHDVLFKHVIQALTNGNVKENMIRFTLHMLHYLGYDIPLDADGRHLKGFNIVHSKLIYESDNLTVDVNVKHLIWLLKLKHTSYETTLNISDNDLEVIKLSLKTFMSYHLNIQLLN